MKSNLRTLTQKYNLDAPQMAQTLSSMGRKGDTLLAHITPQEAALLKRSGGAGTRNPRTGLLEFYDADGSGNAADSGSPTGADSGASSGDVGSGGGGFAGDNANYGMANVIGDSVGNIAASSGGGNEFAPIAPAASAVPQLPANFNEAAYLAANPDVAAAVRANQMASGAQHYLQYGINENRSLFPNALPTATPASNTSAVPAVQGLNFAAPSAVPGGASELSTLMRQYGIMAPSVMPSPSQFPATTAGTADAAKQEADKIAYQNYLNEYMNRLSSTDMYNRPQFLQDPSLFAPQWKDILAGPGVAPIANTNQIYDMYSKYAGGAGFARGGRVGYAEGGEVEGEREERSSAGAMTPDQARRYRELMTRYLPSTNYGPQLAAAQQTARSEADAFSNMIRQMSERAESPTSRAEMYFRLASAFGAPTRTGQFTENLALAGREMGEVARGRQADEAERRALGLRAQELRMAGARQDLASLQALAGQESAERRAILPRIIEAEVRANTPNARETRINDIMQTYGVGRPIAIGIVDNVIQVIPGGPGEPPVLVNRVTEEIIPTRMGAAPVVGTQPAGQPAEQPPVEQPAVTPGAPAAGEIPAVNMRRQQAVAPTVPAFAPAVPGSVEDFYAGRRQRQVEQAGQTAEAEARGRVTAPPAPRQDFRYTQDFQAVEPIPGSQAAQEREQSQRAERVRRETTQQMGGTVIRAIDDIQQTMRTATFPTTGYFGQQLSTLGGSAANNIRTDIETIRSNIGIDQLNQMRQASPTGAALGNVTDRENTTLQSLLGNLDQSQTEAQFLRNLRRLRETYIEIINYGIGNRPPVQIPGPGGRGTAEPPARGEIRTPSGLTIRPIQ